MIIEVKRTDKNDKRTIGLLYIDDQFSCYTLEDTCRSGVKIPGETAIPSGVYSVIISHSKRFGKALPEVLDVPGFTGIRIHAGNTDKDTRGCILVGLNRTENRLMQSQMAMDLILPQIQRACDRGETVTLHIR